MNRLLGFNGQRRDPLTGFFHAGNGYRTYNPVFMRFTAPDNFSPFGAGGINPYAYCSCDPINRADPSGHMSTTGNFLLGLAAALGGALLTVLTDGSALAVAGALLSGLVSSGLSAASTALEGVSSVASRTLNWLSIATGFISPGAGESEALRMGESALGGVKSGWIALGDNPVNISALGYDEVKNDVGAIFSDQENGVNQIILSAHGYQAPLQNTAIARLQSTESGRTTTLYGEDLGELMLDHREQHNVRGGYNMLLMCHSGTGGRFSAAARASAATGDPVVGFEGPLVIRRGPFSLDTKLADNFNVARAHRHSLPDSLVRASADTNRLVKMYTGAGRRNPYRFFEIDKMCQSGYRYRPVVFFPDGSFRRGDYDWLHANSSRGLMCDPPV